MYIKATSKAKRSVLFFLLLCAAAGFLNGLLGAGGGILLVWAFHTCIQSPTEDGVRDTFAATLAAIVPITALSAFLYQSGNLPSMSEMSALILPAIAGGAIGGLLLGKIPTALLKKIFAVLVLYSGISMVFR